MGKILKTRRRVDAYGAKLLGEVVVEE